MKKRLKKKMNNLLSLVQTGAASLVDVREYDEWLADRAEEAFHFPLSSLVAGVEPPFPKEHTLLVHCRSGARSEQAREILNSIGYKKVINVGGLGNWRQLKEGNK